MCLTGIYFTFFFLSSVFQSRAPLTGDSFAGADGVSFRRRAPHTPVDIECDGQRCAGPVAPRSPDPRAGGGGHSVPKGDNLSVSLNFTRFVRSSLAPRSQAFGEDFLAQLNAFKCGWKSKEPTVIDRRAFGLFSGPYLPFMLLVEVMGKTLCIKYFDGAKSASAEAFSAARLMGCRIYSDCGRRAKETLGGTHATIGGMFIRSARALFDVNVSYTLSLSSQLPLRPYRLKTLLPL